MITRVLPALAGMTCIALLGVGQAKRPVTPRDCVQTKYLLRQSDGSIKIDPSGKYVAYLVKSPNLETNSNDIALYVRTLEGADAPNTLLVKNPNLSQITWLRNGNDLAALERIRNRVAVVVHDVRSLKTEVIASPYGDIEEYGINDRGDTLVYAVRQDIPGSRGRSKEATDRGYRIENDSISSIAFTWRSPWIQYDLYVQRRTRSGSWTHPVEVKLRSPFTGKPLQSLRCLSRFALSLSPDGTRLVVNIADIDMAKGEELDGSPLPADWLASPRYKHRAATGVPTAITVLHDLQSGRTSMPIAVPGTLGVPQWAPNGRWYYLVANAPVGSKWEREDEASSTAPTKPYYVWQVEPAQAVFAPLTSHVSSFSNAILWTSDTLIGIRTGPHSLISMAKNAGEWAVTSQSSVTSPEATGYEDFASNGRFTVVDYAESTVPPELRIYEQGKAEAIGKVSLNPEFRNIALLPSKDFHWTTSNGTAMTGSLVLPAGYVKGTRYPLVIQTKNSLSAFACDAGNSQDPSFAPQPMATQGIMYLTYKTGDRNAHYPSEYPGGIGEAAFYTDLWDTAVAELDREGMIDPHKVGIIGFSRTGWHVEFALVNGKTRYAAATAADNIQFSLGEYWLAHTEIENIAMDSMYGGSPYGSSLSNWMKYSISFNLPKVHTPLLIEAMGNGVPGEANGSSPADLNRRYEIVSALRHLKKPVEMYYYPNEPHQPEHPMARLASIQRNVDWYRFWLQDFERPSPEDPAQYGRWRELRHQRNEDSNKEESAER